MAVELYPTEKREISCHSCYAEQWVPPVWPTFQSDPELMQWNEEKQVYVPIRFLEDQKKIEHGCKFAVTGA